MLSKYYDIVGKIKSLEIQGATNVAIYGLKAISYASMEVKDINYLKSLAKKILDERPTEPLLKNSFKYLFSSISSSDEIPEVSEAIINKIKEMKERVIEIASKKISDGDIIFTHCHSSTVVRSIIRAFRDGKNIEVINTETRPKYQGRITAKELAREGIKVTHIVDSAMAEFLRKATVVFVGADAITSEGYLINKIGTRTLAILAEKYDIPFYSLTLSWKYDPETVWGENVEIEERNPKEVWKDFPEGVIIRNPAFSVVEREYVTGVITEIGILPIERIGEELKERYSFIFSSSVEKW